MARTLQDQLLNMGMANKGQAKKAKDTKRKQTKLRKSGIKTEDPDANIQSDIERQRQEKQERDRLLNQQREEDKARKAGLAEALQLIQQHSSKAPKDGSMAYNFVHDRVIKTLHLDRALHNQLSRGQLAIVILQPGYGLMPDDIAARVEEKAPQRVIRIKPEAKPDEDDPYADYQIPDDLMW
jgi:uncharacterized protein YaiL (DUF2058 family)